MAEQLTAVVANEPLQAWLTHEAGRAIGQWLEARGRLDHPIHRLTMGELEAMATAALSRFIVLASQQIRHSDDHDHTDLTRFLLA